MCDAIQTDQVVDGLPALIELTQYPEAYDNTEGDALADVLSEVASAVVTGHPAGFAASTRALSQTHVISEVTRIPGPVCRAPSPTDARQALVDGARRCVALIRMIDEHLAANGATAPFAPYDMEAN